MLLWTSKVRDICLLPKRQKSHILLYHLSIPQIKKPTLPGPQVLAQRHVPGEPSRSPHQLQPRHGLPQPEVHHDPRRRQIHRAHRRRRSRLQDHVRPRRAAFGEGHLQGAGPTPVHGAILQDPGFVQAARKEGRRAARGSAGRRGCFRARRGDMQESVLLHPGAGVGQGQAEGGRDLCAVAVCAG